MTVKSSSTSLPHILSLTCELVHWPWANPRAVHPPGRLCVETVLKKCSGGLVGSSPCPPNAFSISSLSHSFFHLRLIFIAELFEYEGDSPQVKNILWLLTLAALPACNRWIYSYYSIEYDAWWGCPHTRKKSLHNLPSNRSLSDAGRPSSAMVWNGFPGRGMAQLSDLYSIFKYIFWCLG